MGTLLGAFGALIWTWLLTFRGSFWRSGPTLDRVDDIARTSGPGAVPITVVIPARNEAEHIGESLESLLTQEYAGDLRIVVVDDNSTDETARVAGGVGARDARVRVVSGAPLEPGWSGKMWAVSQGLKQPEAREAEFVLLTDADILHGPYHVAQLAAKATQGAGRDLDLVSEMVMLRTESLAERALIPAFVFFFQMLYPFRWVGDPHRREAAAAGGTMLVSRAALQRIGDVDAIRGALIDDVALAREVKRGGHSIWLGHATQARSLRRYCGVGDVFQMISRTAYVQLNYSPWLLAGTVAGMALVYAQPVALTLFTKGRNRWFGVVTWAMMAGAFQPTLRRYRRSPLWGLALPAIALFYMSATVGSAVLHYRRRGGRWKDRVYSPARSGR